MKKLVIFDLDGTLLNTIADLAHSTNHALRQNGFPTHDVKEYNFFVGNGINKLFERALPEGEKTEENILKVREEFLKHYDLHNTDRSVPYPGIPELLAYRRAVDKLTELLVAEGAIHAVRLKQKSKTKRKKKIAAAIYEYQADCDGEWGEISVDFENGTAEIIRLADWDTIKTNWFANEAIRYILSLSPDALKKYMLVPLEPPLIS